ncbi:MAG: 30S ribosomal protein S2 [Candidatus Pacebacteria bacterium]|nr:30S ribosomal protein S2 [Candidatus Paceibacterota bacterium]
MSDQKNDQKQSAGSLFIDASALFGGSEVDDATLLEMAQAGVLYGHKKSRRNPRFGEYIFTTRNGVEVLDLVKTAKAIDFVAGLIKKGKEDKKNFIIVGTQPAAHDSIKALSQALGDCPFVINKWIGGLITNFSVLSKRITYYKQQKQGLEEKKFEGYTKKERLMIAREVEKMQGRFSGFENIEGIPDIMIVIDGSIKGHATAIHEARLKKVKVFGIIDSDDNPGDFDYFIPANDHARSSISWVINRIIQKIA